MKHKFSDIDKATIGTWILIGAGLGAFFVGPLFKLNYILSAGAGTIIGLMISLFLFREPPKRKHKTSLRHRRNETDRFGENYFIDLVVKKLAEAYRMEHPNSEYAKNYEGINEVDQENGDEDDKEASEKSSYPIYYADEEDQEPNPLRLIFHPTQLPIILGILWFIAILFINRYYPDLINFIYEVKLSTKIIFAPTLFLVGLSGFMIVVQGKSVTRIGYIAKGFEAYMNGIIRLLFGWGFGLFLVVQSILDQSP
jgi:hypothetical protein